MTCPTLPGAPSRRRRLRGTTFAVSALTGAAPACAQALGATATPTWLPAVAWSVAALGVVAAGFTIARLGRQRRELADELRTLNGLREVLDVWQWRCDAQARLTEWRPPRQAPLTQWGQAASCPCLWEHFQFDASTRRALQAQIESRAPFSAVPAQRDGVRHLLDGQPCFGADGRFSHYVGIARELPAAAENLSLPLLQALPFPAVQVGGDGPPTTWQVQGGNTAAAQWLSQTDTPLAGLSVEALIEHLPAEQRAPVQGLTRLSEPASLPLADGGTLRVLPVPSTSPAPVPMAWLLFQPAVSNSDELSRRQDAEAFSYTVSHDLRAPVRVVEGFARILKEDYGRVLDRIGNDHLDRVMGAAARMNGMIDSLLALAQLSAQPLSRQPINLSQLAGYIVDDLRRQSPERQVRVEIEPGLQTVGDATLLRVALENLLGNAWKYTAKRADACIWFEASEHEGRPAFTVRDNGAGFDMRFADRLFGVFQRLHSASEFQGTGVGLASVRRIIQRHGGDIWAEGQVDRGARFQFWLG